MAYLDNSLWIDYALYGIWHITRTNSPLRINTQDLLSRILSSLAPQNVITSSKTFLQVLSALSE